MLIFHKLPQKNKPFSNKEWIVRVPFWHVICGRIAPTWLGGQILNMSALCEVSVLKLSGNLHVSRVYLGLSIEASSWRKYEMSNLCLQEFASYIMEWLHDPFYIPFCLFQEGRILVSYAENKLCYLSLIRLDSFIFSSYSYCFSRIIALVLLVILHKHLCTCLW